MAERENEPMMIKRVFLRLVMVGLSCLAEGAAPSAQGALTNVNVGSGGNFFSPAAVVINVNDSVKWTWVGSFHSSTSTAMPALWDSGVQNAGFLFTNVFTSSGVFGYKCTVHPGMVGSVTVQAAAQPPSVSLTNPASGATFAAPWTSTLKATATGNGGTVTNVEFFNNSSSLGKVATPPYNLTVSNEPAAGYSLTAVASDNLGAKGTSAVVNVSVVAPVNVVLSGAQRIAPTHFRFTYTANPGLSYVVQRTGALPGFAGITTNLAAASSISFTDNAASADFNLYRVGRLPNP
jgi:plastocyanin